MIKKLMPTPRPLPPAAPPAIPMVEATITAAEAAGTPETPPAPAPETPPAPAPETPPAPAPETVPEAPAFKPTIVLEPGQALPPELAGFPPVPPLPELPSEPEEAPVPPEPVDPGVAAVAAVPLPVDQLAADRTKAELAAGRAALIAHGHDPDAPRPEAEKLVDAPTYIMDQPRNFSGRIPQSTLDEQAAGREVIRQRTEERDLVQSQERKRKADANLAGAPAEASDLDYPKR